MKSTIIVDTGIIIEYLRTGKGVLPMVYEKYTMVISAATYVEILASKTFLDSSLEKEVIEFLDKYFSVEAVDERVAHQSAKLMREYDLNLATANIAAAALVNSYQLLTGNRRSFEKITGITFLEL